MERVFKPIFSLVLSGYDFHPPCQLNRTDWFNFETEISGHFCNWRLEWWNRSRKTVDHLFWSFYSWPPNQAIPWPKISRYFGWIEYNPRILGSFGLTRLFSRENRSLHEFFSRGSKFSSKHRNKEINQFNDLKFLIASLIFDSWFQKQINTETKIWFFCIMIL